MAGNAFGLGNSEINDAIKKYLKQNDISQSFSINKKLKLPNCKKNIDLYYRNFYSDLLLMSENIIDFFKKIDTY